MPDGNGDGGGVVRRSAGRRRAVAVRVAVASVVVGVAVRVAVRGVRVHVHVAGVLGGALLVHPARGGVVDGARLPEVRALVVAGGDGVDHHGDHGGAHGDEPGEGERGGAPAASAAGRRERVERGGEDVHHAGGEDDPGGERLDGEEDVPVGPERGRRAAQDGDQHPRRARRQDGRHRDELEPQRPARVLLPDLRRRAAALALRSRGGAHGRRHGHQEEEDEEGGQPRPPHGTKGNASSRGGVHGVARRGVSFGVRARVARGGREGGGAARAPGFIRGGRGDMVSSLLLLHLGLSAMLCSARRFGAEWPRSDPGRRTELRWRARRPSGPGWRSSREPVRFSAAAASFGVAASVCHVCSEADHSTAAFCHSEGARSKS